MELLGAVALGALLASLSDWLFARRLFHDRYKISPEIWRSVDREWSRVAIAGLFAVVTATGFVMLAQELGLTYFNGALKLALMIWLIAPLPLLVVGGLVIKVDQLVVLSHAAGWLVKLLLIAAVTQWLL